MLKKTFEAEEVTDATVTVAPTKLSNTVTENCDIFEVNDELCFDEHYGRRVDDSGEEFLEYFRIMEIDSKKPEKEFVTDILRKLDSTLKKAKFKEPNEIYRFVKSGRCKGNTKVFIQTKNIPEVLAIIKTLASKNIEITKMPR